ncbi:hypothetical protein GN956_G16471 [Arapaima gigas]
MAEELLEVVEKLQSRLSENQEPRKIFTDVMKVEKHVKEEMVLKLMIEAKVMREETVVKEAEEEKLDVVEMVVKKFVKL